MSRGGLHRAAVTLGWLLLACGGPAPVSEREPPSDSLGAPDSPIVPDSLIVPDTRIGPVRAGTSERELIERLGAERVVRREAHLGEGFCAAGSLLDPGTVDELEIVWSDSTYSEPALVRATQAGSGWRTARGVGVGSTLAELERVAGGPIEFSGFGWDYGGSATWLEESGQGNGTLALNLAPDSLAMGRARADPRYREILGERQVRSDHPLIQTMGVRVVRISVRLGRWPDEQECSLP